MMTQLLGHGTGMGGFFIAYQGLPREGPEVSGMVPEAGDGRKCRRELQSVKFLGSCMASSQSSLADYNLF